MTEDEEEMYIKTKTEFEDKMFERVRGMIFRSKIRWYEGGEKNTKYFFALETAKYNAKHAIK